MVVGACEAPRGPSSAPHCEASWDKTVKLWNAKTGALQATLEGHTYYVDSGAFLPDGRRIVTVGLDLTVRLWDAATGALQTTLWGHFGDIYSCTFSPDGKHVVTACMDRAARLWDAAPGAPQTTLGGHDRDVMCCAFSTDGTLLLTASGDWKARLWNVTVTSWVFRLDRPSSGAGPESRCSTAASLKRPRRGPGARGDLQLVGLKSLS